MYEEPIYPKHLYLDGALFTHAEFREQVIERRIDRMIERDIWKHPDVP